MIPTHGLTISSPWKATTKNHPALSKTFFFSFVLCWSQHLTIWIWRIMLSIWKQTVLGLYPLFWKHWEDFTCSWLWWGCMMGFLGLGESAWWPPWEAGVFVRAILWPPSKTRWGSDPGGCVYGKFFTCILKNLEGKGRREENDSSWSSLFPEMISEQPWMEV